MTNQQPQPLITRDELLEMYQRYPGALAEEVKSAFVILFTDSDRVRHNVAVDKIVRLCIPQPSLPERRWPKRGEVEELSSEFIEAQNRLCDSLARVIIETAIREPVGAKTDGKG